MEENLIIEKLRCAYDDLRDCRFKEYINILEETGKALENYPESHRLRGEWLLIKSLADFPEPEKLIDGFGAALKLIGGRSEVLKKKQPMCLDFYNIFGIYYRIERADEIADLLEIATDLFEKLTGTGPEIALCYRAQLSHYRGNHKNALVYAEKAYYLAIENNNHITALCTAELVGRLAKHDGNEKLWNKMQYYIDEVLKDPNRRKICHEVAESIKFHANMSIGVLTDIPTWIKTGDFGVIAQKSNPLGFAVIGDKISPTLLYHVGIVHIEYLFYNKKYIEAINMGGLLKYVWKASPFPFGDVYIDFLLAGNYRMVGDFESAHEFITSGVEKISRDGLWLIPSEFILTSLGSFILDTVEKYDAGAVDTVRNLGVDFWNKGDALRNRIYNNSVSGLNDREYEVALLAADRFSNAEISKRLFITESTVKFHLSNIYGKLCIKKRSEIGAALEKNFANILSLWKQRKDW